MKKIIVVFLTVFMMQFTFAATTTIDFETINSGYTASSIIGSGNTDTFNRVNTGVNGNSTYYWVAEDISGYPSIDLTQIDITGATSFTFSIDLSYDNAAQWDATDELLMTYSTDGGTVYSNLMWVQSLADAYNNPAALDLDFSGDGDAGQELSTSAFSTFITSAIDIASKTTLDIKLQFNNLTYNGEGIFLDNIVVTSSSGSVSNPSGFSATASGTDQIDLAWTENGSGNDVLIAWNSSNTFGTPVDGNTYTASTSIPGGGTSLGTDADAAYSHTSLTANTQYFYRIWSVDGSTDYSSGVTANATTSKVEPTNHVTSLTVAKDGTNCHSAIDISWTANDGAQAPDGYLIKASTADNITDPSDATAVSDNATIGSNSGAKNITHGTNTYEWTGLTAETTYYFKVYPYTNSGTQINYKTSATVPNGSATTDATPTANQANDVIFNEIDMSGSPGYAQEAFELLVVNGPIDMRGWIITEDTESDEITFASNVLWSSVATGTYITVYVRSGSGITEDVDASDKSISVKPDGAGYISGTTGLSATELFYLSSGTLSLENAVDAINAGATVSNYYGLTIPDVGLRFAGYFSNGSSFINDGSGDWTAYGSRTFGSVNTDQNDSSLPVELSLWTAQSKSGNVFLNWTTDSEIENLGFIIERKGQNQKSYQEIASYLSYDALKGQGSSTQVTEYHFIDKAVEVGQTYFYRLTDIDYQGKRTGHAEISVVVKAADEKMLADHFRVKSCYPNPFNPSTTISYELTEAMTVTLHIFDVQGREIYSQVSEPQSAGTYEVQWNGKDANGGALNSGIYIARLEAGANYSQSLKLIYLQ